MDNHHLNKEPITPELLNRVAEGDENSFASLYRHYSAMLTPIHWRCVEAGVDPEEVIQLTFLKVWLNRDRLKEIAQLKSWIARIAFREYLMAVRKKLIYEGKLDEYSANQHESGSPLTPYQSVNYSDLVRCIQEIVSTLSPQRKLMYSLSRNEGLSVSEIAERLNLSVSTVKNTLQAVQQQIREQLVEAGYGPYSIIVLLLFFPFG